MKQTNFIRMRANKTKVSDERYMELIREEAKRLEKRLYRPYIFEVHPHKGKDFLKDSMVAPEVVRFLLKKIDVLERKNHMGSRLA